MCLLSKVLYMTKQRFLVLDHTQQFPSLNHVLVYDLRKCHNFQKVIVKKPFQFLIFSIKITFYTQALSMFPLPVSSFISSLHHYPLNTSKVYPFFFVLSIKGVCSLFLTCQVYCSILMQQKRKREAKCQLAKVTRVTMTTKI